MWKKAQLQVISSLLMLPYTCPFIIHSAVLFIAFTVCIFVEEVKLIVASMKPILRQNYRKVRIIFTALFHL